MPSATAAGRDGVRRRREERFQLNEDSLWSGGGRTPTTPPRWRRCRRFASCSSPASTRRRSSSPTGRRSAAARGQGSFGSYSTLGDLHLTFDGHGGDGKRLRPRAAPRRRGRAHDLPRRTASRSRARRSRLTETRCLSRASPAIGRAGSAFARAVAAGARESRCPRRRDGLLMSGQLDNDGQPGMKYAADCGSSPAAADFARGRCGQRRWGRGRRGRRDACACTAPIRSSSSSPPARTSRLPFQRTVANRIDRAAAHSFDELRSGTSTTTRNSSTASSSTSADRNLRAADRRAARRVRGRRRRPGAGRALLPARPLPADRQLAPGRPGGQPPGHLGRGHQQPVELRLPHEHQRADELLARGDDQPAECVEPLFD